MEFRRAIQRIGAGSLAALLVACGGGGSDAVVVPPGQATQGLWRGAVVLDGQDLGLVIGLVAASGQAHLVLLAGDSQLRGHLASTGTALDTAFSGLSLFGAAGELAETFTLLDGSVNAGTSLAATLVGSPSGRSLSLALQYDARYDRPGSFAALAGSWQRDSGGQFLQWQIDAAGTLAGTDSNGCSYAGQFTLPDPAHNLYRVSYRIAGCATAAGPVEGLAALDDGAVRDDTLHVAGTAAVGPLDTASFVERLTRQPPAP